MTNKMLQKDVETLATRGGFTPANARVLAAISMVEAPYSEGGKSYTDFDRIGDQALADSKWGYSYGAFQIRSLRIHAGTGLYRDAERLSDPEFSVQSALTIWKQSGFSPWSTYMTGQYKAMLQELFPTPPGMYVVVPGDTLGGIATRLKVGTWQDLARVNAIRPPFLIFIGQKLLLPWFTYTVKPGDSLSQIVATYGGGVTVPQVAEFNQILNANLISIGQVIRIPRSTL